MKSFRLILLVITSIVSLQSFAGEISERFEKLAAQAAANPQTKIAALLRHYGDASDFKIIEESTSSEACLRESRMRAKIVCDKTGVIKKTKYFAEGKGLLCKVSDSLESLECLISR